MGCSAVGLLTRLCVCRVRLDGSWCVERSGCLEVGQAWRMWELGVVGGVLIVGCGLGFPEFHEHSFNTLNKHNFLESWLDTT